ncbi:sigma factor-like helix-turn-helix DNA-binding protein [Janibacter sp. LM]|uniref:sigma factor-like helix-turn-helix DNA-binding protein n=1 Tax=Janibacter sp. LM TaxID=3144845 RepID=UPI0031F69BBE
MSENTSDTTAFEHSSDLATLLEWARFAFGVTTWGGVEEALSAPTPSEVTDAVERLRGWKIPARSTSTPIDLLTLWRTTLDDRESDILTRRLLRLGSGRATLDELGQAHGVTRERVRQIETQLLKKLRGTLRDDDYRPVRWALFQLEDGLGTLAPDSEVPIDGEMTPEAETFRLLLHVGGYVHDGEKGIVRKSDFQLPGPADLPLVDEGPLIDEQALRSQLLDAGVAPDHVDFAVTSIEGIRRLEGDLVLWPRNIATKGVAVLAVRQRPMTPDEIADVIDEDFNRRGFRNRIFGEPLVMRSSRHHVALRAWGLPEYGGIVPAMVERLTGGPVQLSALAQDLAEQFGVSTGSVLSYSGAPVFRVSDGIIELRPGDDPFVPVTAPVKVPGLYRHDTDRLAWHVRADHDILRGSGRAIPDEIAVFLDGSPPMAIQLRHAGTDIPLAWAETSHTGPSIGSIRAVAEHVGARKGDLLRLTVDRADRTISAHVVDEALAGSPTQMLTELTGLGASHLTSRAAVASCIGAPGGDAVALLVARGDEHVAELVATLPADRAD